MEFKAVKTTQDGGKVFVLHEAEAIQFLKDAKAAGKYFEIDCMAALPTKRSADFKGDTSGYARIRVGVRTAMKFIRDVLASVDEPGCIGKAMVQIYSDHDSVGICPL